MITVFKCHLKSKLGEFDLLKGATVAPAADLVNYDAGARALGSLHSGLRRVAEAWVLRLAILGSLEKGEPAMVLGDFNAEVGSQTLAPIEGVGLADVVAPYDTQSTYSTGDTRIDLILADAPLAARVRGARVIETGLSDHRAVLVELQP